MVARVPPKDKVARSSRVLVVLLLVYLFARLLALRLIQGPL